MNIDHKRLASVFQASQKDPILTVGPIRRHPGKAQSVALCPLHDFQGQRRLRLQDLAFQGHTGSFTPGRVFYPLARQIQFRIDQADELATS